MSVDYAWSAGCSITTIVMPHNRSSAINDSTNCVTGTHRMRFSSANHPEPGHPRHSVGSNSAEFQANASPEIRIFKEQPVRSIFLTRRRIVLRRRTENRFDWLEFCSKRPSDSCREATHPENLRQSWSALCREVR